MTEGGDIEGGTVRLRGENAGAEAQLGRRLRQHPAELSAADDADHRAARQRLSRRHRWALPRPRTCARSRHAPHARGESSIG